MSRENEPPLGAAGRSERANIGRAAPAAQSQRRPTRDLTTGSVPKNVWFLSWPQMVEGFFNALDNMADLFWAGRELGFRAIGGIGVAHAYAFLITMARTKNVHNVRRAMAVLQDRDLVSKLFDDIGPYYAGRPGGYTRVIRLSSTRLGDNASKAYLGFVRDETSDAEQGEG